MLKDLVMKNRTYRRFNEAVRLDLSTLEQLVDLARLASSAQNAQALKYILVANELMNQVVFEHIKWAAALPDWPGPVEGERPSGYIIVLQDESINQHIFWDVGLALANITLGAVELGLGCCQFGSINRPGLAKALGLDSDHLKIQAVLALGVPVEEVVLTELSDAGDTTYYRDEAKRHFVPKRALKDLIIQAY